VTGPQDRRRATTGAIRPTSETRSPDTGGVRPSRRDAFLFTGHLGEGPVQQQLGCARGARRGCDRLETLHFHDLRHAGNTLALPQGPAQRAHGSMGPQAAGTLIYQHATSDRDQAIASALSNLAAEAELTRIVPRDGRAMEAL